MDIRFNINKIDYDLSSKFGDVKILEKSSLKFGKYFEVEINESKKVKMIIPFKNIDGPSVFDWYYYSNPLDESSDMIPRSSNIKDITSHIEDIIINERFSEDYKNLNK
jgi:hypothetical protein